MILKILAAITFVSALTALLGTEFLARILPCKSFVLCFVPVFLAVEALLAVAVFERRAPIFGPIFWKGAPGLNRIALTFDDGPNEPFTSRIADILKEKQIRATFFVAGRNCERFPGSVKRLAEAGHEVGNHTWSHEVLPLKTPARIREEIARTSARIEEETGKKPSLFRAPHGWRNPWVNRIARECGCAPVAWTLGVWDTDLPGVETIVRRTLEGVRDGCVLLLHDGRGIECDADSGQLVRALPVIVDELERRGFTFVTLSEMMRAGPR
ncbi:MAG: polysaccharide deacetylase family protein [Syntrophobacteraceae bacterium]